MNKNKMSVIIPSYKNPTCLDICLNSAINGQSLENEFIVVLDGFVDQYENLKEKYNNRVNFIDFADNQGMQTALNVGVFHANNDKILIVNDDNVFPIGWDVILIKDFKSDTIITPNQIERAASIFSFVIADFGDHRNFRYDEYINMEPSLRQDSLTEDGEIFPFLMMKRDYMAVGGFDTLYNSPFICDWDFFLKLELIGKKFLRSRKLNFYHFGSVSTKNSNEREKFNQSEREAFEIFEYKWGFSPIRNPNNSHGPCVKIKGVSYEL